MKSFYFTLALLVLSVHSLKAQSLYSEDRRDTSTYPYYFEMMQDPEANFYATQRAFKQYYAKRGMQKGNGYKVFKRWEYFMENRVSSDGAKPSATAVMNAYQQWMAANPALSTNGNWTELGPKQMPANGTGQPNGLGRVNAIAFHPTSSQTIWVGTPSGGLWKTIDGGVNWLSSTDQLPTLGVSAILVDSTNPGIIYIGTGDRDGGDAPGMGVMKSTNGGATWSMSNTGMGNVTVGAMLMDPSNDSVLFAATSQGIYKSSNAAASWAKVSVTASFKDIRFKPGSSTTLYASANGRFYRSVNSGSSWTLISSGLPSTGRLVIGVSPANPNYVYAVVGSGSGLVGCYRSTDSGQSFSTRSSTPNILGYSSIGDDNNSQATYDLCIAVDPNNVNTIYVGGINVWKSTNGGSSWSINAHWVGTGAPAVHADQHVLEFSPLNGNLYLGNDGGFYLTSNGGVSWTDRSDDLAIAQVYKIGQSATAKNWVINGYQDNGTAIYKGSAWHTEIGGDGMECIIDPVDSTQMYGALYYGDIRRSTNNGINFSQIAGDGVNGINESGAWVTPYTLQEGNHNIMYVGYENVWRSTNVYSGSTVSWTKISTFGSANNTLRVIESSPANNNILYAARFSTLYRTDNAQNTSPGWTTIALPASCTDLEAHPTDPNVVYMTAGNNVYKSTNKGVSWSDISGNLPNVSMNTIVFDTTSVEGLYVGTDAGVYYREQGMSNWVSYSTGLPVSAEITELEIYYSASPAQSRIRAGTYGRGLWSSELYTPGNVPPIADFQVSDNSPCVSSVVSLSDQSAYAPASWQWTITPSSYSFVAGTTSSSQFPQVKFNATGSYTIKLWVSNANGSDSITKSNYVNVTGGKSFPYNQSFESFGLGSVNSTSIQPGTLLDGWSLDNSGVGTWVVRSGGTPSSGTGPMVDHTLGNSSGVFLYTETSSPTVAGDVARLVSPCVDIPSSGNPVMEFYYHMYGAGIISLKVDVLFNGAWTNVWTMTGQQHTLQTAPYSKASISLSAYLGNTISVRFTSERPSDQSNYYQSDIAIDDVVFKIQGAPQAAFVASEVDVCSASGVTLIDQSTDNPTAWNWSFSPNTVTFINGTSASSQNPMVQFNGNGMYDVTLVVSNNSGSDSIVKTNYITAVTGNALPYTENFESFTLGSSQNLNNGWEQIATAPFEWTINQGVTTSNSTGPSYDHTLGSGLGKYIYTEATSSNQGEIAELISPCIDLSSGTNIQLSFWYHMYGAAMGSLDVDVLHNGSWTTLTTLNGQQQTAMTSPWLQGVIDLSQYAGGSVRIRFKATRGSSYTSDMAIDDVKIVALQAPANDEPCSAQYLMVNTSCSYSTYSNHLATSSSGISNPSCGAYNGHDVWFKMLIPVSGFVNISTNGLTGGVSNGAMAAYTGTCNSLSLVSCDDNSGVGNMPALNLSGLSGGDTLYIRFWDYGGFQQGDFEICAYEPTYLLMTPVNYIVGSPGGSVNYTIQSNQTWTLSDDATWLTLSPSVGMNNSTVTATYTANPGSTRTATITVTPATGNTQTVTLTQYSGVYADFTFSDPVVCKGQGVAFTNASINHTGSKWYIDGLLVSSSLNYTHSFASTGTSKVTLVAYNSNDTAEVTRTLFIKEGPHVNAGMDTSLCEGESFVLNGLVSGGINVCNTYCNVPLNYCASASNSDNFEYISKVELDGNYVTSSNQGNGYEDHGQELFAFLLKDSSYALNITGTVMSAPYLEYVDVFIDWNRNGLFDEAATSFGSYNFLGDHVFSNTIQVPSSAVLGKTRMRIILKYNSAIAGACENAYAYGETEDYMIEIGEAGGLSYAWAGPSGYSSSSLLNTISPALSTQSGTYSLTVMDGMGCSDNDAKVVNVNSGPTVSFSTLNDICESASPVSLTQGSPSGGVYSGPGVSGNTFSPTLAGMGTHTLTYTYTNGTGCSAFATQSITVNPLPQVSYTGLPASLCLGDNQSFPLLGTPAGGTFTGTGITGSVLQSSLIHSSGNHMVSYAFTDGNGCVNTASQSYNAYDSPVVNAGPDDTIAYGNTTQLTATVSGGNGNYTYAWTPSNLLNGNGVYNPSTLALTQSTVFGLQVVDGHSCMDFDTLLITVIGGPLTLNLTAGSTVLCEGESTQLQALVSGGTGNTTYTWSSQPVGFTSSIYNPVVSPTVTTTYQLTVNDGVTTQSSSVVVMVNPVPNVQLSSLAPMCENDPITMLSGGVPAGGAFSGPGVGNVMFDPSVAGPGAHTITYTYTTPQGCSDSATATLTIFPKPQVSYSSSLQLCTGGSPVLLTGGSPVGGSYSGTGISMNQFFPSLAGTGQHSVTYVYSDANGCMDSAQSYINVYAPPVANAGTPQSILQGNAVTLSGSASGGSGTYAYVWSPNAALQTNNAATVTTQNLTQSTYFTLHVNDMNTSCSDSDMVLITVTGGPVTAQVFPQNSSICEGQSQTLLAIASGGTGNYVYSWYSHPTGFTSSLQNPVVSPTVTTSYTVQVTSGSSGMDTAQAVMVVHPVPYVDLGSDTSICDNQVFTLDAGSGFASYAWSTGASTQSIDINPVTLSSGIYNYVVTVSAGGVCTASDTISIGVGNAPYVNLGSDLTMCTHESRILDAGFGFASYLWSTGATTQFIIVDSAAFPVGLHDIWVEVGNQTLCPARDSLRLQMDYCAGLGEQIKQRIALYPNPGSGDFRISLEHFAEGDYSIEVYASNGQLVHKEMIQIDAIRMELPLKLTNLARGVYQLQLRGSETMQFIKLVIQ